MEQYHIEVLVSGDIAKSKDVLQQFVAQVNREKKKKYRNLKRVNEI